MVYYGVFRTTAPQQSRGGGNDQSEKKWSRLPNEAASPLVSTNYNVARPRSFELSGAEGESRRQDASPAVRKRANDATAPRKSQRRRPILATVRLYKRIEAEVGAPNRVLNGFGFGTPI